MSNQTQEMNALPGENGEKTTLTPDDHRRRNLAIKSFLLLILILSSAGGGFLMGRKMEHDLIAAESTQKDSDMESMAHQINPTEGYTVPAVFGAIGPQMVAAGAIDMAKFVDLYKKANRPLGDAELSILTKENANEIVITPQNAHFLLNFFWAFGLANDNPILTEGAMVSRGIENVGGFASTGGWTLGAKASTELFSSTKMIVLTEEQQARLLEVASAVYRPCCDNPTHFPDCNHGMAMLGLLELMASQGATTDEMFEAAKYVNAFWYPQQTYEIAMVFKLVKNADFNQANSREVVSRQYSSGSGFQQVHQWLGQNGVLEQAPSSGGGSCGVQ